ncbi:MAG: S-adenosyl-L-methionine-dependent methyltransferase [Piptocephalis tieghemiana]|nr:MAG: S-adenosyl-L-methionine-dependent methyltransferase [Piptocephalis tieghemiana]
MSSLLDPDQQRQIFHEKAALPKGQGWDDLWKEGVTPWIRDRPSPAIEDLVRSAKVTLPTGRYLVPGCGIGRDVYFYASLPQSTEVWGVDISSTAMEQANRELASHRLQDKGSDQANLDKIHFKTMDLFSEDSQSIQPFDLIYDYTFLCALPPTMRPRWAERITQLTKPDGLLIALAFPLSDHLGGPPPPPSMSIYHELLDPHFTLIHPPPPAKSLEGREGKERLTVCPPPVSSSPN